MMTMPNSTFHFCNRIFLVGGTLWLALAFNACAAAPPQEEDSSAAAPTLAAAPTVMDVAKTGYEDEPQPYDETRDARKDVDDTLFMARMGKKNAIVVMGANWCHDSRGLAGQFLKPRFQTLFEKHYEVVYVDMGIRNRNLDIAADFGIDKVEGTPTVIVVNPEGEVINLATAKTWRNADSRSEDAIFNEFKILAEQGTDKMIVEKAKIEQAKAEKEKAAKVEAEKEDVKRAVTEKVVSETPAKSTPAPRAAILEKMVPAVKAPETKSPEMKSLEGQASELIAPKVNAPEVATPPKPAMKKEAAPQK
jgi:thiol-disulfide isomerase/thioredoxin